MNWSQQILDKFFPKGCVDKVKYFLVEKITLIFKQKSELKFNHGKNAKNPRKVELFIKGGVGILFICFISVYSKHIELNPANFGQIFF